MTKKLISLHSTSNDGIFDCNFNDDIIIDKGSHVSFVSCSLTLDNNKIIITNDNNLLQFKIGGAPLRSVRIPQGIYSPDNIGDLIMRIQNGINSVFDINQPTEHGQSCLIILNDQNKIEVKIESLTYATAQNADGSFNNTSFTHENVDIVTPFVNRFKRAPAAGVFPATASSNDQFDSYIIGTETNTRGCGGSLVKIVTLSNNDPAVNAGFVLGWVLSNKNQNNLNKDDLTYYVHAQNSNLHPYLIKGANGSIITTTHYPRVNDVVGLVIDKGRIMLAIYNVADAGIGRYVYIDDFPYDKESHSTQDPFFSVINIFGQSTTTILQDFKVLMNPHAVLDNGLNYTSNVQAGGGVTSQPPAAGSGFFLYAYTFNWPSAQFARDLGYNDQNFGPSPPIGELRLRADNLFTSVFHPDNYKIELLNINLESYDSQTQGRRNILAIIPISETFLDQNVSLLQFEPNNILPLSVKNHNKQALRNIRARLIDSHNEPATTYGLSFINIMVEY